MPSSKRTQSQQGVVVRWLSAVSIVAILALLFESFMSFLRAVFMTLVLSIITILVLPMLLDDGSFLLPILQSCRHVLLECIAELQNEINNLSTIGAETASGQVVHAVAQKSTEKPLFDQESSGGEVTVLEQTFHSQGVQSSIDRLAGRQRAASVDGSDSEHELPTAKKALVGKSQLDLPSSISKSTEVHVHSSDNDLEQANGKHYKTGLSSTELRAHTTDSDPPNGEHQLGGETADAVSTDAPVRAHTSSIQDEDLLSDTSKQAISSEVRVQTTDNASDQSIGQLKGTPILMQVKKALADIAKQNGHYSKKFHTDQQDLDAHGSSHSPAESSRQYISFWLLGSATQDATIRLLTKLRPIRVRNFLTYRRDCVNEGIIDVRAGNAGTHDGDCIGDALIVGRSDELSLPALEGWEAEIFKEIYGVSCDEVLERQSNDVFIEVTNKRGIAMMFSLILEDDTDFQLMKRQSQQLQREIIRLEHTPTSENLLTFDGTYDQLVRLNQKRWNEDPKPKTRGAHKRHPVASPGQAVTNIGGYGAQNPGYIMTSPESTSKAGAPRLSSPVEFSTPPTDPQSKKKAKKEQKKAARLSQGSSPSAPSTGRKSDAPRGAVDKVGEVSEETSARKGDEEAASGIQQSAGVFASNEGGTGNMLEELKLAGNEKRE